MENLDVILTSIGCGALMAILVGWLPGIALLIICNMTWAGFYLGIVLTLVVSSAIFYKDFLTKKQSPGEYLIESISLAIASVFVAAIVTVLLGWLLIGAIGSIIGNVDIAIVLGGGFVWILGASYFYNTWLHEEHKKEVIEARYREI